MMKCGPGIVAWAVALGAIIVAAWMKPSAARDCGPGLLERDLVQIIRLEQWAGLHGCLTGPDPDWPACCKRFDYDGNRAIDMRDVAEWHRMVAVVPWERAPDRVPVDP